MRIRSLEARNFLRFSHLRIANLPPAGLIGIEGPNESGKSTLGDLILFALFGRSRLQPGGPPTSLIRWGAEAMEVSLDLVLTGPDDPATPTEQRVLRQVDRYGTNYAKVTDLRTGAELACGNLRVAEHLAHALGAGFEEFCHAFYHDQELRPGAGGARGAPGRAGLCEVFDSAAGIDQLREAGQSLVGGLEPVEREFAYFQKELRRNRDQIARWEENVAKLPGLRARATRLAATLAEQARRAEEARADGAALRSLASGLDSRAHGIAELRKSLRVPADWALAKDAPGSGRGALSETARKGLDEAATLATERQGRLEDVSRRIAVLRSGLESLRAEVDGLLAPSRPHAAAEAAPSTSAVSEAGLTAGMEAEARSARSSALRALLWALGFVIAGAGAAAGLAALGPEALRVTRVMGSLAGAAGVFLILVFLELRRRRRALGRRLARGAELEAARSTRRQLEALRDGLNAIAPIESARGVSDALAALRSLEDARVAALLKLLDGPGETAMAPWGPQGLDKLLTRLAQEDREAAAHAQSSSQRAEKLAKDVESESRKLEGERERLLAEVRECESQEAKKTLLEERTEEIADSARKLQEEIEAQRLAVQVLEESASSLRVRAVPVLTGLISALLADLTGGKYRDVRVSESLEVRVFSSQKHDFLSLPELSGGTNEALHLLLRLALTRTRLLARPGGASFVFLDEPFKMMDPARRAGALEALATLHGELGQVFIAQPGFFAAERARLGTLILTSSVGSDLDVSVGTRRPEAPLQAPGRSADPEGSGREAGVQASNLPT